MAHSLSTVKQKLLRRVLDGVHSFKPDGDLDAFQATVQAIEALEEAGFVTVKEYRREDQSGKRRVAIVFGVELTDAGRAAAATL